MKVRPWKGDAIMGLILCAVGLWWLQMSWSLGLGSLREPGPGFFPAAVAIALALGGLGCTLRALRLRLETQAPIAWMEEPAVKAVALIVLLCVLFPVAGFAPSAALFLFAMIHVIGKVALVKSAVVAVIVTAGFWLVFDRLLAVQLPVGMFS